MPSIIDQQPFTEHVGNGVTTSFAYAFELLSAGDFAAFVDDVEIPPSQYTVGGIGSQSGGTCVFTTAPANGSKVLLVRELQLARNTEYQEQGDFLAGTVNLDLNRIWQALQQQRTTIAGAIRVAFPRSINALPGDPSNFQGYYIGIGAGGNPTYLLAPGGTAAALAGQLANATSSSQGPALIGYGGTPVSYPAGSLGKGLNDAFFAIENLKQFAVADADVIQSVTSDLAAGTARSVDCFGDSTMWGADPSNLSLQVAIPPPAAMRNLINSYHGNSALTAVNRGNSGTNTIQMLAGLNADNSPDGSGQTFAQKVAATTSRVIFCNHCINNAAGSNATSLAQYRGDLLTFVYLCRLNGKAPVLVTPMPPLTIGTFGSQARAEATARFAEEMRKVARDHSVTLVDNYKTFQKRLGVDGQLPFSLIQDGIHGSAFGYGLYGNNMAEGLLAAQLQSFTRPGQRIACTGSPVKATGQTVSTSTTSRVGAVVTTGSGSPQSMRMVFKVEEPGMDIVLGHPVWSNGAASIDLNVSGEPRGTMSMLASGFPSPFWQDFETLVARNLPPGVHILLLNQSSGSGGIGLHYLRSRAAEKPLLLPSGSSVPAQKVVLGARLELNSSNANTSAVFDDLPASCLQDVCSYEWTGQMLKDSGVIIGGNIGTNGALTGCERAITIQLNSGTGFLSVQEATAPGVYTSNAALNATDLSTASHTYRFILTSTGPTTATLQVLVDGASIGTQNLTGPYRGGLLGLWKNQAGGSLAINSVVKVWGL